MTASSLKAGNTDTMNVEAMNDLQSVEPLLRVPGSYTVLRCDIILTDNKGQVTVISYCRDAEPGCATVGRSSFPILWQTWLKSNLSNGCKMTLSDIQMQNGKWVMNGNRKAG